jgi:hypothetical protein
MQLRSNAPRDRPIVYYLLSNDTGYNRTRRLCDQLGSCVSFPDRPREAFASRLGDRDFSTYLGSTRRLFCVFLAIQPSVVTPSYGSRARHFDEYKARDVLQLNASNRTLEPNFVAPAVRLRQHRPTRRIHGFTEVLRDSSKLLETDMLTHRHDSSCLAPHRQSTPCARCHQCDRD